MQFGRSSFYVTFNNIRDEFIFLFPLRAKFWSVVCFYTRRFGERYQEMLAP
jgi:hypothetical protein